MMIRLEMIRPMLAAVQPTRISNNIMGELYSKLMINACINTASFVHGEYAGSGIRRILKHAAAGAEPRAGLRFSFPSMIV